MFFARMTIPAFSILLLAAACDRRAGLTAEAPLHLEEHLADCEGCTAYLEQLRVTIGLSGRLSEEAVSPEAMAPLLEAFRAWRRG